MSNGKKENQLNKVDEYLQRMKNAEKKKELHEQCSNASKKQKLHHEEDVIGGNSLTKSVNEDSTEDSYNNNGKHEDSGSIPLTPPIRVSNRISVLRQSRVDNESTENSRLMHSTPIGENKKKSTTSTRIVKSVKSKAKITIKGKNKKKPIISTKIVKSAKYTAKRTKKGNKKIRITKKKPKSKIRKNVMANRKDKLKKTKNITKKTDSNSSKNDIVKKDYKTDMERIKLIQPDFIKKFIKDNQDYYIKYKDKHSKKKGKKDDVKDLYKCYPFNSQQQLAMYLTLREVFNAPNHNFLEYRFLFTEIMPEVSRLLFAQTFKIKISAASRLIKILYPTPVCPV